MENFKPLNEDERVVIEKAREAISKIPSIPCTSCEYCVKGCPQKIQIPSVFSAYNRKMMYDDFIGAQGHYFLSVSEGGKASDCIACGACESVCPQHINISENLKTIAAELEKNEWHA